jgi:multimeric flavodoxin WrbA
MKGAEESGNTTEKIYVSDRKIGWCRGCYACQAGHICVQKDEMAEILDKMLKADVIVLSTPVYFYTMDGQIKTLIDRTLPRYTDIRNKDFYFIATAAAGKGAMECTIDGLCGFTDCLPGAKVKGLSMEQGHGRKVRFKGIKL